MRPNELVALTCALFLTSCSPSDEGEPTAETAASAAEEAPLLETVKAPRADRDVEWEEWAPVGAAAAKLLLPYHPDRALAVEQEAVAADIVAECRRVGIPLVLEPLFYGLDSPADRRRVVVATTRRFAEAGPDLLKLPFPVDSAVVEDRAEWYEACAEISALCPMPWALLSGGGDFEVFFAQVGVALDSLPQPVALPAIRVPTIQLPV